MERLLYTQWGWETIWHPKNYDDIIDSKGKDMNGENLVIANTTN